MARIVIQTGERAGESSRLGSQLVIGRSKCADLVLAEPTVSRLHALVLRSAGGYLISDLNSHPGTLVNGVAITEFTPLEDGDRIGMGTVVLVFRGRPAANARSSGLLALDRKEGPSHQVMDVFDAQDPIEHLVPEAADADELGRLKGHLRVLTDVATAAGRTLDGDSLRDLILEKLFEVYPQADHGAIVEYDDGLDQIVLRAGRSRQPGASETPVSRTLARDAMTRRQGVLSCDAIGDDRFSAARTVHDLRIRSVMCVPMIAHGSVYGAIQIYSSDLSNAFTRDDVALLMGIARQAALSLENSRLHAEVVREELLRQDLELAHRIQLHLLPQRPPEAPGYSVQHHYGAALQVSGDYFGYFPGPGGGVGMAIGDVSGKGVAAALYMAQAASLATVCFAGSRSPGAVLRELNARLVEEAETGMFMTMVALMLDVSTGELVLARAGHPLPLLRRPDGTVEELDCPGNIALGVAVRDRFDEWGYRLRSGESITLYTDGVTDAENPSRELFGLGRLIEVVAASPAEPAHLVPAIVGALERFRAGRAPSDDVALLCLGADGGR